jgi:hypothetical protein
MTTLAPSHEIMEAYVYGTLPPDEARDVRMWFVGVASEKDLEAYEDLVLQRESRERGLASWAAHPQRARLFNLLVRTIAALGKTAADLGDLSVPGLAPEPAPARLGPDTERVEQGLDLEVSPGQRIDPILRLVSPCYALVVLSDKDGNVTKLSPWPSDRLAPSDPLGIELRAPRLERGDVALDIIAIIDRSMPLPEPPSPADVNWLADVLSAAVSRPATANVHRVTIRIAQPDLDLG